MINQFVLEIHMTTNENRCEYSVLSLENLRILQDNPSFIMQTTQTIMLNICLFPYNHKINDSRKSTIKEMYDPVIIPFNTLRPRQNGRHFADAIFKCIFLNENARISLKISLEFVPKVRINNIPALVQIMAWRRPGDKPLSEPMMVSLLTHICITRPQWVNRF